MMDQRDRMIERQAKIISDLNEKVRGFDRKYADLEAQYNAMMVYATFYKTLQETIMSSPTLLNEWQSFMFTVKMVDPDQQKYEEALSRPY